MMGGRIVTKTCLVSDSNLFRTGLKHILANSEYRVESEAESIRDITSENVENALLLVRKPTDVAEIEGDVIRLKQSVQSFRLVFLAGTMSTDQMAISFSAGADGFLLEEISSDALLESLNLVMLGEKVFPSRLAVMLCSKSIMKSPEQPALIGDEGLSGREIEVVQRLAGGMPNKVIAKELEISEATVKVHLKSILKKLQVTNRTQAAIWALQNGLFAPPPIVSGDLA
jgi:two-component system nitrate/nitrite response regulator NarL